MLSGQADSVADAFAFAQFKWAPAAAPMIETMVDGEKNRCDFFFFFFACGETGNSYHVLTEDSGETVDAKFVGDTTFL